MLSVSVGAALSVAALACTWGTALLAAFTTPLPMLTTSLKVTVMKTSSPALRVLFWMPWAWSMTTWLMLGVVLGLGMSAPGALARPPSKPPPSSQGHMAKLRSSFGGTPRYWSLVIGGSRAAVIGAGSLDASCRGTSCTVSTGAVRADSAGTADAASPIASSLPGLSKAEARTSSSRKTSLNCGSVNARRPASGSTICSPE